MVAGYNTGVQNRICRQPHPGKKTQIGNVFSHRTSTVARGSRENALQKGNCRGPCRDSGSTVLLKLLLSPQEGQRHETSNQLEGVEHLCSTPSLQDGGPTHTERPPEDRRLDDQGRSEGVHDPDTQLRQINPLLQVQSRHYQYTYQLFGLSCAPWVFTKTLKPVLTLLRELAVRLVAYIDDVLVLAETAERARYHTNGLIYLLENMGFLVHLEKTVREPTQEIEFLGMMVDSKMEELCLPGQKLRKIRQRSEIN